MNTNKSTLSLFFFLIENPISWALKTTLLSYESIIYVQSVMSDHQRSSFESGKTTKSRSSDYKSWNLWVKVVEWQRILRENFEYVIFRSYLAFLKWSSNYLIRYLWLDFILIPSINTFSNEGKLEKIYNTSFTTKQTKILLILVDFFQRNIKCSFPSWLSSWRTVTSSGFPTRHCCLNSSLVKLQRSELRPGTSLWWQIDSVEKNIYFLK